MSSNFQWILPLLTLTALGGVFDPGMAQETTESVTVLSQKTGRLATGNTTLEKGDLLDIYETLGRAEQPISIALESIEFAPYISSKASDRKTLTKHVDLAQSNLQDQADSLLSKGIDYYRIGEWQQALDKWEQALELYQQIGDRRAEAQVLGNLGIAYANLGDYHRAIDFFEKDLAIVQEIRDRDGEVASYGNLGLAYQNLGDYYRAIDFHEKALELAHELGTRRYEVYAYNNLGLAYQNLGDYHRAIDFHEKALELALKLKDRDSQGGAYGNLGIAHRNLGNYLRAIDFHEKALEIALEFRDRSGEGNAYGNLGIAYNSLGDYHLAIDFFKKRLEIAQELGERRGEGGAYNNLGKAYINLKNYPQATEAFQQALIIFQEIEEPTETARTLSNLGELLSLQDKPTLAIVFYKQSVRVREDIRSKLKGLPTDLQESYTTTVEDDYRELADLLLQQDRILEAQQVLDLLKIEELDDYLRGVRGFGFTLAVLEPEREILDRYNAITETAITIGQRLADLREISLENRSADQQFEISNLVELQEEY